MHMATLASLALGPVQFDEPVFLWLAPVACALVLLMARKSLSGLGPVTRWAALAIRLLVVVLIVGAMAEPHWRRESKDVAVIAVVDSSESVPSSKQTEVESYIRGALEGQDRRDDRLGVITTAKSSFVQALPSRLTREVERQHLGPLDGTDLAAGVRLALAVKPTDAATRILLASDGIQTAGNVLQVAETAKALGVPIDVLPLQYRYDEEVIVDRLVAPASAREGETLNLRVVLQAVTPARGLLTILMNGEPVDLDPEGPSLGARVVLKAGPNVLSVPVKAISTGPQRFEAVFEPEARGGRAIGDSVAENNRGQAVTFVSGEGKVLVLAEQPEEARYLLDAMAGAKIKADVRTAEQVPTSLTDLNAYDAVVLVNQAAYGFTQKFQEDLRQYVHDTGGGLLMVGGPDSFGAGGWIGSPIEDALPIKLDPPQKRQMPRGALVLVVHSVEAPEGTFLGKKVSEAAVNSLSRLDLIGIIEYGWGGGTDWVLPLGPRGDGTRAKRAINNLMFGDMPDFTPSIELAYEGLSKADAGQRHVIMISDGDPSIPSTALLDRYVQRKITISTVGVFPHSGADTSRMQQISRYTGGRHYHINTQAGLATVPEIFVKEAQTVRRSLIWEGTPFTPQILPGGEAMRGLTQVPPISGYVVAAEREGLALVSLKGKEGDPILAQWQHGLGKVVTYTSDATSRWNAAWISWPSYRQFWEQHLRWVMRPGGSANVRVVTENRGDQTVIIVEALDAAGERLNFATFKGRLALPDGRGIDVDLNQVGPGRYQGVVQTDRPGSYVVSLRYAAPDPTQQDGVLEGSVQAAVTRPYADEYRTLEDNTPLLRQVAELTGGRVLTGDPRAEDLWLREGLRVPVALRAIWLWVAVLAITLFLMDVGVRRVRIDLVAMWRAVARGASKSTSKDAAHVGSLRAAREQARAKMQQRSGGSAGDLRPDEAAAGAVRDVRKAQRLSGVKFEATPAQAQQAAAPIVMGGADARVTPLTPPPPPRDAGAQPGEGLGRLMKAKQKAREGMDDEGAGPQQGT
ncbi:MAG: glutamine amidotransferase [Planctomycetota bacterium]|nr:glutamine amidotransferase [Planctomycetota bacterium]